MVLAVFSFYDLRFVPGGMVQALKTGVSLPDEP